MRVDRAAQILAGIADYYTIISSSRGRPNIGWKSRKLRLGRPRPRSPWLLF